MSTTTPTLGLSNRTQAWLMFAAFVLPALVNFANSSVTTTSSAVVAGAVLAGLVALLKESFGEKLSSHTQAVLMLVAFLLAPVASYLSSGNVSSVAIVAALLGGLVFAAKESIPGLNYGEQGTLATVAFIVGPVIPVLQGNSVSHEAVVAALVAGFIAWVKETTSVPFPSTAPSQAPSTVTTATVVPPSSAT